MTFLKDPYMSWYRRYDYTKTTKLQLVSPTIRSGMESLFLSIHQFSFSYPASVINFCREFPIGRLSNLCQIVLMLDDKDPRVWKSTERRSYEENVNIEMRRWKNAMKKLPPTIRTVMIILGPVAGERVFERPAAEPVADAIRKVASGVRITFWPSSEKDGMSNQGESA